ncbi:listerin E3 ubiquitin protein ligase 1, partial [Tulasnella sp. 427]
MPKPGKSSASSGTRKKHAKRAATRGHEDDEELAEQLPSEPKGKKSKKADKKAPRPKVYIPPVKPAPPRRDPLELHGLASRLPADLVVVLRLLGKKDAVTKGKALDELQAGWIEKAKQEPQPDDEEAQSLIETLEMMLPVWFHHYPVVALHSSRRVRLAAAQLQASLWASPQLRPRIQFYMNETAGTLELEQFLGSWCMTTFDGD